MADALPRLGLTNHGGFFSPYYLFDLLGRQHGDELDLAGRDTNRRALRRVYRRAEERHGAGSSGGEAWNAWHRELLEALGFTPAVLRRLDGPIETARQGDVPISHGAYWAEPPGVPAENQAPLVYVDTHGFGTDLDRALYTRASGASPDQTEEPIARAVEFVLDHNETRWALVLAGSVLRLYRKGGSVARQYLEVKFPALFDADRDDELTAVWGLLRYVAFVPAADGKCLLDRVLEEGQRHAARIADDLRENVVLAVEAIIQGVLDDPANREVLQPVRADGEALKQLFEETLYLLYRLLFILYAESRDLLPVGGSLVYRDSYSLEHLRELAERPLHPDEGDHTYFQETLRTLFGMLRQGFPPPGTATNPGFFIEPFNGQLFDPRRMALLDTCRIPDRALHAAISELSLSRPKRRSDRRERFSYADLGVDQLGSIYEGLLVYEPAIVTESTVLARVKGDERWVSRTQADANELDLVAGLDGFPIMRQPGQFILRLWGGRRKGSGSYYTPQEITSFLVQEALEPLVTPIISGCGERDERGRPARHASELLELKVCDPAMGSGAFLIQACRYLAEAYGRARIAEGLDDDARLSSTEFAAYKRLVAERCLYGVDLNPMAVELSKVSLWLETLARGRPLDFLDAHSRCGNSLIGAPLRDADGNFGVELLLTVPDEALKEVSKESSPEEKATARERIWRNKEEIKHLQPTQQRAGQLTFGADDWGVISLRAIEAALTEYVAQRATLERSDDNLVPAEAVALIHEKERVFEHLQTDPQSAYLKARLLCDLWCSIWFWPPAISSNDGRGTQAHCEPPTTQTYLELASALMGTDPGSLTEPERAAYWHMVNEIWRKRRFFHWELEFPEVWRDRQGRLKKNGGFDAVVGNPPWDTVSGSMKEFFSNYDPLIRDVKGARVKEKATELREDPTIKAAWIEYDTLHLQMANYFKQSGVYEWFALGNLGKGDFNVYRIFLEANFHHLRMDGRMAQVLPDAFYLAANCSAVRKALTSKGNIQSLYVIENRKGIFPSIDSRMKIALLCMSRGGQTDNIRIRFFIGKDSSGRDLALSLTELRDKLGSLYQDTLRLSIRDIRRFSPDSFSLMEFKSQSEIEAVSKIYSDHPLLGTSVDGSWNLQFTAEFHMTNDHKLFRDSAWLQKNGYSKLPDATWLGTSGRRYVPLYEGKQIHQFRIGYDEFGYWICEDDVHAHKTNPSPKLGHRLVARNTDEATLIATLFPANSPAGNSLAVQPQGNSIPAPEQFLSCAILNSFILNFVLRLKVSANLNIFMVAQLPFPRVNRSDRHFAEIVRRTAQLICTQEVYAAVWADTFNERWQKDCGITDLANRAQLRAEIDAQVADLFGLSQVNFAYILSTFPLLDRDQPPLPNESKSYITRDLALFELFKLRGNSPPDDIVAFNRDGGLDIAAITGPVRGLEARVQQALAMGAVAYLPNRKGGADEESVEDDEEPEVDEAE